MSLFDQLGVLGLPLLICFSLIVAIIGERSIFFLWHRPLSTRTIERLLGADRLVIDAESEKVLGRNRFGLVVRELIAKKDLPKDEREGYFSIQLLQMEQHLSRFLPLLRILATISPLLGLLGTVLGMISAFEQISALDQPITPALVAGGISQALLTTAAGLIMAIPALIAHSLFQMRTNRLLQQLTRQLNMVNLHIQNVSRRPQPEPDRI